METAVKIADYLGVTVDYLLGKEDPDGIPEGVRGETEVLDQSCTRMIPLYETVSAGFGAYASDNVKDYIPSYIQNDTEAENTIFIRVRGDSMNPRIEDGDIIRVHKQDTIENGEIAVVLLDGEEGLVKKLVFLPTGVVLHSTNQVYPPMRFEGTEANRVRVVGLVTQVIKGINGRKVQSIKRSDTESLIKDIENMTPGELRRFNEVYNSYIKSKGQK
jgi:SOS-response transcriptional repressor LexA